MLIVPVPCVGVQSIADILFQSEAGSDLGYCFTERSSSCRPKRIIEYPDTNHEVWCWHREPSKQDKILINADYHMGSHPNETNKKK